MERWQADRLNRARDSLEAFITKAERQIEKIERQIEEARKARRQLSRIDDWLDG